ncbi:heat shock 70 kDa protein 16 [Tanacetum coccineum]
MNKAAIGEQMCTLFQAPSDLNTLTDISKPLNEKHLTSTATLLAGLKPLKLIHDGTAIALAYGMHKTDFSDSGSTNVIFVDIGHCDTHCDTY